MRNPRSSRRNVPRRLAIPALAIALGGMLWTAAIPSASAGRSTNRSTETAWTHVGSACTPDETSIGLYDTHVHAFKFRSAATGSIFARCNVGIREVDVSGDALALVVNYTDPDVNGRTHQVRALLRGVDRQTGANRLISEFDSNTWFTGNQTNTGWVAVNERMDFDRYAYYVELRLTRNGDAGIPAVNWVSLSGITT